MENPLTIFKSELDSQAKTIGSMLQGTVPLDRFVAVVMTAVQRNPSLLRVDRRTLMNACMDCARYGLIPDGSEAALTTYKDRVSGKQAAQLMVMVKGVIKRARELGDLSAINAYCVFEKDACKIDLGSHLSVEHAPHLGSDRGKIVGAYAVFRKGSEIIHIEYMPLSEIEKTRGVSRAGNSGAWRDWYEEMARKAVIRRGAKSVPMSSGLSQIIQHEDQYVDFSLKAEPERPQRNPFEEADVVTPPSVTLDGALASCQSQEELRKVLDDFKPTYLQIDEKEQDKCRATAKLHSKRLMGSPAS